MFPQRMTRIRKARIGSFSASLIVVCAALLSVFGSMGLVVSVAEPAGADNWAPVSPGDFPDPSILPPLRDRQSTTTPLPPRTSPRRHKTINIQESRSTDGVNWTAVERADALPDVGAWAKAGDTWAPSVVYDSANNVRHVLHGDRDQSPGDQCIGVATSVQPAGPYSTQRRYRSFAKTARLPVRPVIRRPTAAGASTRTSSPTRRQRPA